MALTPLSRSLKNWRFILVAVLAITTIINIVGIFDLTGDFRDFHPYWYAGLYIRQHTDPFKAYLQKTKLQFPIQYIDGSSSNEQEIQDRANKLETNPTYTGPLILLITLLSFIPWSTASLSWLIINLIFTFVLPFYLLRLFRIYRLRTHSATIYLLPLMFLGMNSTFRGVLENGQSTIFVFFLMLIALDLVEHDQHILSGLILAIALSKYNVSLPLAVFFLLERRFKALVWAGIFFFLSIIVLGLIINTSPITILTENINLAVSIEASGVSQHFGVHMAAYFPPSFLTTLLFGIATVIPLIAVLWGHPGFRTNNLARMHTLSALLALSILTIRHLGYDACTLIIGIALLLTIRADDNDSPARRIYVGAGLVALILVTLPGSVFRLVFHSALADQLAITAAALIIYACDILILTNMRRKWLITQVAAKQGAVALP